MSLSVVGIKKNVKTLLVLLNKLYFYYGSTVIQRTLFCTNTFYVALNFQM